MLKAKDVKVVILGDAGNFPPTSLPIFFFKEWEKAVFCSDLSQMSSKRITNRL